MSQHLDGRFQRRDRVVHRELESGAVLLDLESGSYFQLNPVGLEVWKVVEGANLTDLIDHVKATFDGAPDSVDSDVADFVSHLLSNGLIVDETNA